MRLKRYMNKKWLAKYFLPPVLLLIAANVLTLVMCMISEGTFTEPFIMPSLWAFIMNTLITLAPMLVLFYLVRRLWIAYLPAALFFAAANYFDYLKVSMRGETILPCDLTILAEAAKTTTMLEFTINSGLICGIVLIAVSTVVLALFDHFLIARFSLRIRLKHGWIIALAVAAVSIIGTGATLLNPAFLKATNLTPYQWKQLNTRNNNGFFVNFMANIPYILPDKPSDYSEATVDKLYSQLIAELSEQDGDAGSDTPNIVVIMNESFIDAEKFSGISFDSALTPTLHSVAETKTGGTHFTPQFGGGTANVEFELLTGYSLRFLPASSTPYQQHIKKKTDSYVSFLRDSLGYSTIAIHSYGASFWNRDDVYPLIGFEQFIADDDFIMPLRWRGYISDESTADMIIYQYEENLITGKPFFNFTVTMQNHGSYHVTDYDEFYSVGTQSESPLLSEKVRGMIESYATSIRYADKMLEQIIDYFSTVDEPTIVVFFGDHLGSFGDKDASYLAAGYTQYSSETDEAYYDLHTPPFVIWDNYTDISASPDTALSTYCLLPYMTDIYSLPQPLYFKYLTEQMKVVKGTAGDYYLDSDGVITDNDAISDSALEWLDKQQLIQYDAMFGKHYVSDKLWQMYSGSDK